MFPLSGYVDVNQTYQHDGVTLFNGMLAGKPQTILYFQPKNQAILAVFLEADFFCYFAEALAA